MMQEFVTIIITMGIRVYRLSNVHWWGIKPSNSFSGVRDYELSASLVGRQLICKYIESMSYYATLNGIHGFNQTEKILTFQNRFFLK